MTPLNIVTGSALARPSEAILGSGYQLLIDAEATDGAYELMKFVVPPGLGPPKHKHSREDELYYFLSGSFEVTVGSEAITAQPGTYLHLPRCVPHGLLNVGGTEGSFLCWVIPGNLGALFEQIKEPWPADQIYPPVLNYGDIAKMTAAAAKFGIELTP